MQVELKNDAGDLRKIKVGLCWSAFFFGPFPFLFRGMTGNFFLWAFVILPTTFWLGGFYLWFAMNKMTALFYLERGYQQTGEGWQTAKDKWGLPDPAQA